MRAKGHGREVTEKRTEFFFTNSECPYFPCHEGVDPDDFNCLFCYCPLYFLREKCGGDFRIIFIR